MSPPKSIMFQGQRYVLAGEDDTFDALNVFPDLPEEEKRKIQDARRKSEDFYKSPAGHSETLFRKVKKGDIIQVGGRRFAVRRVDLGGPHIDRLVLDMKKPVVKIHGTGNYKYSDHLLARMEDNQTGICTIYPLNKRGDFAPGGKAIVKGPVALDAKKFTGA